MTLPTNKPYVPDISLVIQWAVTLRYGRHRGVRRLEGRRGPWLPLIRAALPYITRALPKLCVSITTIRLTPLEGRVWMERETWSSQGTPTYNSRQLGPWLEARSLQLRGNAIVT
jgi:hypothetical protein